MNLFDDGDERAILSKLQIGESYICGGKTSVEGACVVCLRRRHMLIGDLMVPESVYGFGLVDALQREVGIGPSCRTIPIKLRPVTLHKEDRRKPC